MDRKQKVAVLTGLAGAFLIGGSLFVWKYTGTERPDLESGKPEIYVQDDKSIKDTNMGAVRKYNAALYLRAVKLSDPFGEYEKPFSVEKEKTAEKGGSAEPVKGTEEPQEMIKKENGKSSDALPVLCGILSLGNDRRAIVRLGETERVLKEGESLGLWQTVHIEGKTVTMSSPAGELVLTL